jgi:predicted DCC family thiol-disulfide oxidoreductase YuxK
MKPPDPASSIAAPPTRPVLFYDGECGLCNRLVRLLLRLDRRARLSFAPLQSEPAQGFLRAHGLPAIDFESIVYVPDWKRREQPEYLMRSAGVIAALRAIGNPATRILAGLLGIFPAAIRDAGYRLVGRWRYRLFGPWRPRPLARPEWAERFLH